MHPIVAIVGRPNVGKSRLFNRMVGRRRAIVHDMPGVTRDRHYAQGEWCGREFLAVDTGGLELEPSADLEKSVTDQSLMAIEEADVIVCVFDSSEEPGVAEQEVVEMLRKSSKPVVYAVNKVDDAVHESRLNPYYEFGVVPIFAVSAEHGRGVDDMLDEVVKLLPEPMSIPEKREGTTIAVVGRPNVGKSTIINRFAGEERVVAHEVAGTTRDSIDVEIEFDGKKYIFIDTAGVKKHYMVSERVEKFTAMRSLRTVDRADIVCQLIDGAEGLTKQDMHLTSFILEEGKGVVYLVNKWDLLGSDWEEYEKRLRKGLGDMHDISILPISALTGMNCLKVFSRIEELSVALGKRLSTSELNRVLERAIEEHHLPVYRNKQVKIYYASQVDTFPPTFLLYTNYPEAMPAAYRKYLKRRFQEALGVKGLPVRIVCKGR